MKPSVSTVGSDTEIVWCLDAVTALCVIAVFVLCVIVVFFTMQAMRVNHHRKAEVVANILLCHKPERTIVFTTTKGRPLQYQY